MAQTTRSNTGVPFNGPGTCAAVAATRQLRPDDVVKEVVPAERTPVPTTETRRAAPCADDGAQKSGLSIAPKSFSSQ